jgi:hypothetical protein
LTGILKNEETFHQQEVSHAKAVESEEDIIAQRLFRYYIGVMSSPASGFQEFSRQVNRYLELPPFQFSNPLNDVGGQRRVCREKSLSFLSFVFQDNKTKHILFS